MKNNTYQQVKNEMREGGSNWFQKSLKATKTKMPKGYSPKKGGGKKGGKRGC